MVEVTRRETTCSTPRLHRITSDSTVHSSWTNNDIRLIRYSWVNESLSRNHICESYCFQTCLWKDMLRSVVISNGLRGILGKPSCGSGLIYAFLLTTEECLRQKWRSHTISPINSTKHSWQGCQGSRLYHDGTRVSTWYQIISHQTKLIYTLIITKFVSWFLFCAYVPTRTELNCIFCMQIFQTSTNISWRSLTSNTRGSH